MRFAGFRSRRHGHVQFSLVLIWTIEIRQKRPRGSELPTLLKQLAQRRYVLAVHIIDCLVEPTMMVNHSPAFRRLVGVILKANKSRLVDIVVGKHSDIPDERVKEICEISVRALRRFKFLAGAELKEAHETAPRRKEILLNQLDHSTQI